VNGKSAALFDPISWVAEMGGMQKTECWYTGDGDLTGVRCK